MSRRELRSSHVFCEVGSKGSQRQKRTNVDAGCPLWPFELVPILEITFWRPSLRQVLITDVLLFFLCASGMGSPKKKTRTNLGDLPLVSLSPLKAGNKNSPHGRRAMGFRQRFPVPLNLQVSPPTRPLNQPALLVHFFCAWVSAEPIFPQEWREESPPRKMERLDSGDVSPGSRILSLEIVRCPDSDFSHGGRFFFDPRALFSKQIPAGLDGFFASPKAPSPPPLRCFGRVRGSEWGELCLGLRSVNRWRVFPAIRP